ncbi:MAG: XrtA/PEP-CTERM system TPR-repeat protein PrsT, partial [Polaromonas sp.]
MKSKKSKGGTVLSAWLVALVLAACSEKPEAMIVSAKDYLAKNDSKAAVIQIKNALQSDPNFPEARFLLGTALLDSGDPVGAETELRKALDLKHPQDLVIPPLASALLAQGQAKKLTDEFSRTELSQAAAKASLQMSLASAYAMQGKADQSQAALNGALLADPGYAPALIAQARQKAGQRDFDGALAMADDVIAKSPKSYEAWNLKGDILLYAKNQTAEALVAYRKAVEVKPNFLPGHAAVTTLLLQQGNFTEAATQVEQIKKFAPQHPQTKYLEAQLAFQKKDFKLARDLVQQVLKATPGNVQGLQLAGAVELELNSLLQAEGYLSKAVQQAPELLLARRLLVVTYLHSGQPAKALATLLPGLSRENVDPGLLSVAGEVYLQNGDVKKAEEYFTKATQQNPKDGRNRTSLALTHLMGG